MSKGSSSCVMQLVKKMWLHQFDFQPLPGGTPRCSRKDTRRAERSSALTPLIRRTMLTFRPTTRQASGQTQFLRKGSSDALHLGKYQLLFRLSGNKVPVETTIVWPLSGEYTLLQSLPESKRPRCCSYKFAGPYKVWSMGMLGATRLDENHRFEPLVSQNIKGYSRISSLNVILMIVTLVMTKRHGCDKVRCL